MFFYTILWRESAHRAKPKSMKSIKLHRLAGRKKKVHCFMDPPSICNKYHTPIKPSVSKCWKWLWLFGQLLENWLFVGNRDPFFEYSAAALQKIIIILVGNRFILLICQLRSNNLIGLPCEFNEETIKWLSRQIHHEFYAVLAAIQKFLQNLQVKCQRVSASCISSICSHLC